MIYYCLRLAKLEPVDLLQFQTTVSTKWVDDCALIVGESRIGVPRAVNLHSSKSIMKNTHKTSIMPKKMVAFLQVL